jgi:hypothetical protein
MPLPPTPTPRFFTFGSKLLPATNVHLVLGVGSRAVVTSPGAGSGRVTLTDDSGANALAAVADGVEVEITAWRPRRGGKTLYRVVSTTGGVEGWLGAESLQPRTVPRPAKPAAGAPAVTPAPVTEAQPARRSPVAVPIGRSPRRTRRRTR